MLPQSPTLHGSASRGIQGPGLLHEELGGQRQQVPLTPSGRPAARLRLVRSSSLAMAALPHFSWLRVGEPRSLAAQGLSDLGVLPPPLSALAFRICFMTSASRPTSFAT